MESLQFSMAGVVALLCFSPHLLSCVFSMCLPGQASALLQLKHSLLDSTSLATWEDSGDCCNGWYGVECNGGSGGVITSLDLSGLGLRLSPNFSFPSLANLTGLKSLNLGFNSFDSFPPTLDGLRQLRHLNLSNAGFTGQIPMEIVRIKLLVSLDLSFSEALSPTSITLVYPNFKALVQGLPNLEELYLNGVDISSYSTEWSSIVASALPKLRHLSLANCFISGPLQHSLSHLRRLRLSTLRLDSNNLASPVPYFLSEFSSLTSLSLSSCQLIGDFPQSVFGIQGLRIVDLSNNPNLGGRLPEFSGHDVLQELSLFQTKFSGPLPPSIGKLPYLTKLRFGSSNFSGELPVSLANLSQLVYLELSGNRFSGQIPLLTNLSQLTYLDISSNRFNGSFPAIGEGLQKLVVFHARNNSITGSIPSSLFKLPSLKTLVLGFNKLGGSIDRFTVDTESSMLEFVDLRNNNLQGPIPESFFRFPRLKGLQLSANDFSGVVKLSWLNNLRNLSMLELSSNRLLYDVTGSESSSFHPTRLRLGSGNLTKFPEFLRNQVILHTLDLSNNRISGEIPDWIWQLPSLRYLNLSNNYISGLRTTSDISVSRLFVLDLHSNKLAGSLPLPPANALIVDYSNNRLTSTIPHDIGSHLRFTIFFSISGNELIGEIPTSICNATYLRVLNLAGNNLTGPIPPCLLAPASSSLEVLSLESNSIDGSIPDTFASGCRLRTLDLNGNSLSGQVPRSLKNCSNLEVINLGNNHIEDRFPSWLGQMSNLRVLVLRSNRFYGTVESCLQKLKIMDLSSNNFHGNLPSKCFQSWKAMVEDGEDRFDPEHPVMQVTVLRLTPFYYQNSINVRTKGLDLELVKIWTTFASLDLSNNSFSGEIPETLGKLNRLHVLNLSSNSLTGHIPRSIGRLVNLESLDLSQNNLSGEIPRELGSLNFLSFLNLSYNSLVGAIPQGGQLYTFSESAYGHNLGLCDRPLRQDCRAVTARPESVDGEADLQSSKIDWEWIAAETGFIVGLGMVFLPVIFRERWRRWYFYQIDSMLSRVFPCIIWWQ